MLIPALDLGPAQAEAEAPMPLAGEVEAQSFDTASSGKVTRHLVSGTSALGLGLVIERGAGFIANILAARLGGASTFGAYSLAIGTANNIATYAGAGIGSTAARFSGKYRYGTSSYGLLARVLALVSIISAIAASLGLWLGAKPIAHLLRQSAVTGLLRWAALSAAGIVFLECARGFFVGQRRLTALVFLSLLVGAGLLTLLPLAAIHHSPARMIASQGLIAIAAVAACILLARPLGLLCSSPQAPRSGFATMLREVWAFGFVQLAGLVGANAAGWWLTTLVARADGSFVQMGFFGIASQLRNMVSLAPGLLTESSFAIMADPEGQVTRTPDYVLGLTTFASSLAAFSLASIGILIAPWLLRLLYTAAYSNATVAVSVGLALAVMHMGNGPASARLSILSIRSSAIVNTLWACFVAIAGTLLMPRGGTAVMAMSIYLAAHTVSSALVLALLAGKHALPQGLTATFALATVAVAALAALAAFRASRPALSVPLTGLMTLVFLSIFGCLLALGNRYRWIPSRAAWSRLAVYAKGSLRDRFRRQRHAG